MKVYKIRLGVEDEINPVKSAREDYREWNKIMQNELNEQYLYDEEKELVSNTFKSISKNDCVSLNEDKFEEFIKILSSIELTEESIILFNECLQGQDISEYKVKYYMFPLTVEEIGKRKDMKVSCTLKVNDIEEYLY